MPDEITHCANIPERIPIMKKRENFQSSLLKLRSFQPMPRAGTAAPNIGILYTTAPYVQVESQSNEQTALFDKCNDYFITNTFLKLNNADEATQML